MEKILLLLVFKHPTRFTLYFRLLTWMLLNQCLHLRLSSFPRSWGHSRQATPLWYSLVTGFTQEPHRLNADLCWKKLDFSSFPWPRVYGNKISVKHLRTQTALCKSFSIFLPIPHVSCLIFPFKSFYRVILNMNSFNFRFDILCALQFPPLHTTSNIAWCLITSGI